MSISVLTPREPLAGPPGDEARPDFRAPLLAESQAGKTLRQIIERYCTRAIAGRSILVAGHRGAGKTSLVRATIQTLRHEVALRTAAIPLYVQIHGPDLLGGETVLGPKSTKKENPPAGKDAVTATVSATVNDAGQAAASEQDDEEEVKQAETSLRVLTIALHRAFVTDLAWAFERAVSPQHADVTELAPSPQSRDLQELAAQLRLDFDDLVETDGLRWMWSRAGFLERGVFRREALESDIAKSYFSKQGLLEIVAATCVSDSYMRGVAKVDDLDNIKAEAEFKQTHEIERTKEKKELVNSVAGVLSGVVAAGAVAFSPSSLGSYKGLVSGLSFLFASILTTTLLNYSSIRSTSRKRSKERSIRWDRSVASLDLMLPLVIGRILDAGRAPIFVIDELDKVNNVDDKLPKLINRLKHIVADRAVFCFLVDRPYFERIQQISRTQPQRKEHTFFSERLYVISTPAQWRTYLQSILILDEPTGSDKAQLLALCYWLMARSKMHAIDVRREIEVLPRDKNMPGRLELPDLLGPVQYRNMIYMQAGVEYVLEDEKLKSRLQRGAYFAQYIYDALYYLLRQWEQDKSPSILRDSIREYLEFRASDIELNRLSDVDFNLLHSAIEQMAGLLSDVEQFKTTVRTKVAQKQLAPEWNDVCDILPDKPVMQKAGDDWQWLFDINANPLQVPSVLPGTSQADTPFVPRMVETAAVADVEILIKAVEDVDAAIRIYTGDLLNLDRVANELRLLEISPTYTSFADAASSYRANSGSGTKELTYPSLYSDRSLIEEYSRIVLKSTKALKRSIFLAELLATDEQAQPTPRKRAEMLRLIADELDFKRLSTPQIDDLLASFQHDFDYRSPEVETESAFRKLENDTRPLMDMWVTQLVLEFKARSPQLMSFSDPDMQRVYLSNRTDAFIMHARNKTPLQRLTLLELRFRARHWNLALHGDPDAIPLLQYANALAMSGWTGTDDSARFRLALLAQLGFGRQVKKLVFDTAQSLGAEHAEDLLEAARAGQRSGERVLLVLGGTPEELVPVGDRTLVRQQKGEGSYAAAWTLSKVNAVFPVHLTDLGSLSSSVPDNSSILVAMLDFTVVLLDQDVPEMISLPSLPLNPVRAQLGTLSIGKPASLDEAVTTITRNIRISSAT